MLSRKTSRNTTKVQLYGYDDIRLKLYMDISSSGDYSRLVVKGSASHDICFQAWEEIVKRNNEANQNFEYSSYIDASQSYALLIADYNVIKACLCYLVIAIDDFVIGVLKEKGYDIDTSGQKKFEESLYLAQRKSDNLLTKIKMRQNEMVAIHDSGSKKEITFDDAIAALEAMLHFRIDDDIKLSRYNAHMLRLRKQHELANRKRHGRD
jgi:hypothetical protein